MIYYGYVSHHFNFIAVVSDHHWGMAYAAVKGDARGLGASGECVRL